MVAISSLLMGQEGPRIIISPTLVTKDTKHVRVSNVKVDTKIWGSIAETQMIITFYNPNHRNLEGDFYFPLPEGASVNGYALDIKGKLIDSVIVSKNKGRQVFEKIVRTKIDPGLLELSKGNNFKTRVFPIPAKGTRTIKIQYVSEIVEVKGQRVYLLPLMFSGKLDKASVRVEVIQSRTAPMVSSGNEFLKFKKWQNSYLAEATLKDFQLNKEIKIILPKSNEPEILIEKSSDGETFFCIYDFPKLKKNWNRAYLRPKSIDIFWDASASRENTIHDKEYKFITAYLKKINVPMVKVQLNTFRNSISEMKTFMIQNGNANDLIAYLKKTKYDGGTWVHSIFQKPSKSQIAFLFSDGLETIGDDRIKKSNSPLYCFSNGVNANHNSLKALSTSNGGQYYNLKSIDISSVVSKIGFSPFAYIRGKGKFVYDIAVGSTKEIRGKYTIVGKLSNAVSDLKLYYGVNGKEMVLSSFELHQKDARNGELLRKLWAQKKLEELMIQPKKNKKTIKDLGIKHQIVTSETSMIVLDSYSQYLQHKIAPPKSLKKWRENYFAHMRNQRKRVDENKNRRIEQVVNLWKTRVNWWKKDFRFFSKTLEDINRRKAHADKMIESENVSIKKLSERHGIKDEVEDHNEVESKRTISIVKEKAGKNYDDKKKESFDSRLSGNNRRSAISIKMWDANTPYIKQLGATDSDSYFEVYHVLRNAYKKSPSFYFDCANFFHRKKQSALALQTLSNIAELDLENASLLRVMAYLLVEMKEYQRAITVFEKVKTMRPEEPQSYRDLALAQIQLAEKFNNTVSIALYQDAVKNLYHVIINKWDRFSQIELICLMELNRIIPKARMLGLHNIPVDKRLIKLLDIDVRIILSWDADQTDIDLWVVEPTGTKAYYGHANTSIGGHVSRDFTNGYGPEEYLLHKAPKGSFKIQTNFFGSSASRITGPVTIKADIYTNYGRKNEKHQIVTVRLKSSSSTINLGEIKF